MKKLFLLVLVFVGFIACESEGVEEPPQGTSIEEGLTSRKNEKIDICHKGNIINVSINALGGHQGHGDAIDMDADGYFDIENDCSEIDCNDTNAEVNPIAEEIVYNGVDDDCNPETLDDDLDGDGFLIADDCDDTDPTIYPGATEICGDGIDQDCDGIDPSCDCPCFTAEDLDASVYLAANGNTIQYGPSILITQRQDSPIIENHNYATSGYIYDGDFIGGPNQASLVDNIDNDPFWTATTKAECDGLSDGQVIACQLLICERANDSDFFNGSINCEFYIPTGSTGRSSMNSTGINLKDNAKFDIKEVNDGGQIKLILVKD